MFVIIMCVSCVCMIAGVLALIIHFLGNAVGEGCDRLTPGVPVDTVTKESAIKKLHKLDWLFLHSS